jgi:hypothetical protein
MASLATSLVGPRTSWLVTSRLLLLHGPARHAHGDAKAETRRAPNLPIYPGLTRSFSIWYSENACFNRPGAEIRLDFRNNLLSELLLSWTGVNGTPTAIQGQGRAEHFHPTILDCV